MGVWYGYGLLAGVLIVAAIIDCRTGRIPNALTLPAMVAGLALWSWHGLLEAGAAGALAGAGHCGLVLVIAFLPCTLLVLMGAMGGGDAKLIGAIGALSADWRFVLGTAFYAFVLGTAMAIALMVHHRLVRRTAMRLLMAVLTLAGRRRPALAGDGPRVPMGAALLGGALIAGLERFGVLTWPWTP